MPEQQQFGASGPYFVARDQLPNPFAAFWHAYLAQYNPKAMAAFTARLRALDPSEQLRYVAALEESKTRLLEAQAANERSVRNAVLQEGLSEDESARLAAQLDMQARGQDTDLAVARIGQQTELTKAGTLSDEGRRIANDLQTRVNAAQRYALETGDLAGMQTQIEQATVKAQADAQNLAPMERTVGLPNAIDGMLSGSMISDPAVRADIRAIVAPAFGRPSSVPTTGAGVRAPRTAEQIRDFASTLRGGGPPAAATTAPATSSPAPAGQGAGTPVPSPGTGGGSGNAAPAGSDADLKRGVKELEDKQAAAAAAPKFGALGGFTDPLPLSEEEQRRWIRAHPGMAREMAGQARPTRIARKLAQARRGASTEPAEAATKPAEPSTPNPLEGYKVTPGDFPEAAKKFAAAKQEKPPAKPGGKPVDKVQATIDAALPPQSDTTVDEFGMPLQSEPAEAKSATPAARDGLMQRLARAAGVEFFDRPSEEKTSHEVDVSGAGARKVGAAIGAKASELREGLPDYRSGGEPLPAYREALPTGGGADAIAARKKLLERFKSEQEKSEQDKNRSAGRKLPKSG